MRKKAFTAVAAMGMAAVMSLPLATPALAAPAGSCSPWTEPGYRAGGFDSGTSVVVTGVDGHYRFAPDVHTTITVAGKTIYHVGPNGVRAYAPNARRGSYASAKFSKYGHRTIYCEFTLN